MSVPEFAPFPEAKVRQNIPPEEWKLYLDSWCILADLYLRLDDQTFASALNEQRTLVQFLVTFFQELAVDSRLEPSAAPLRKKCFLVLHRVWSGQDVPDMLLSWTLLSDVCHAYPKSERLRSLLHVLWARSGGIIEKSLQTGKLSLIKQLDSKVPADAEHLLNRLGPLLKVVPQAGTFMLTGSDFLDSLSSAYDKTPTHLQKKLVTIAYLGLTSLLQGEKPNYSLLSDHLYGLKTNAEQEWKSNPTKNIFLADLVTNTPLLNRIRDSSASSEAARVKNIAASLSAFQQGAVARPKRLVRRKVDKGKGKAKEDEYGHGAFGEVHVHRMSLISQVQDLFPDLGSGFVVKLLDEYNDNVEDVVAHLLEDSLPSHLANADRGEQLPSGTVTQPHFSPRSTPPPPEHKPPPEYQRRNVFDDDEFDRLAVDTSRLHIGRKNQELTADQILSDRKSAPNKSYILAALAAFDSDDDERDDTYDVEDVGGLVDSTLPDERDVSADKNEEALFRAYSVTPEIFGRDAETRRGKARAALKSETGMTDEAIEGWGIMTGRDPKRLRRLEARFSAFSGQQRELAPTAYRGSPAESGDEAQRGRGGAFSGRGRGRGRGRGGGGGRGGGNVAGPADDKGTQVSRQRKEANKGSRANHNRRDQRARKMARGGLPG